MSNVLFTPITLGRIAAKNRIFMAPLTRCRAGFEHIPNELMAQYYSQRAKAGLIVAECTMILPNTSAFAAEPGIYSAEQITAWRTVTDAVHAADGKIILQIWHAGRAAHPALNGGQEAVSASSIAINDVVHTPNGKEPYTIPRALNTDEIKTIVAAYAQAAQNAIDAGFDGVEVHGANGYLIDQFLRDGSNQRTDAYGGSIENRARFLFEVLDAVCAQIGSDRVGLRLSPVNSYNSMIDSNPEALMTYVTHELNRYSLAYLHMMRSDFLGQQKNDIMNTVRNAFKGTVIGNMGYDADEAAQAIHTGSVDAVAFGTGFLANPDLPERIRQGVVWNTPNPATFYTPGANGYTDYPTL